jgi:hypothetical protein
LIPVCAVYFGRVEVHFAPVAGSANDEVYGGPAVANNIKGVIFRKMPGLSHFAPADGPIAFIGELLPVLEEIQARAAVPA